MTRITYLSRRKFELICQLSFAYLGCESKSFTFASWYSTYTRWHADKSIGTRRQAKLKEKHNNETRKSGVVLLKKAEVNRSNEIKRQTDQNWMRDMSRK